MMPQSYRILGILVLLMMGCSGASFAETVLVDARKKSLAVVLPEMENSSQCSVKPPDSQEKRVKFDQGFGISSVAFSMPPFYEIVKNQACDVARGYNQYTVELDVFSDNAQVASLILRYNFSYDPNLVPAARQVLSMNYSCEITSFERDVPIYVGTNSIGDPMSCSFSPGSVFQYDAKLNSRVVGDIPLEFSMKNNLDNLMLYPYTFIISTN